MRWIVAAVLFNFLTVIVFGQNRGPDRSVGQILFAKQAWNQKGDTLKSLDYVFLDDVVEVDSGGVVVFVHNIGIPVELLGDTTLAMNVFTNGLTDRPSNLPEPRLIYETDKRIRRSNRSNSSAAVMDGGPGIDLIYPPKIGDKIYYEKGDLCLKWATPAEKFEIRIATLFDDVDKLTVYDQSLTIPESEMNRIMDKEPAILISIRAAKSEFYVGTFLISKFPYERLDYPFGCELNSAANTFMAGFYLEMDSWGSLEAVEELYIRAMELSADPFYKEMLECFRASKR